MPQATGWRAVAHEMSLLDVWISHELKAANSARSKDPPSKRRQFELLQKCMHELFDVHHEYHYDNHHLSSLPTP